VNGVEIRRRRGGDRLEDERGVLLVYRKLAVPRRVGGDWRGSETDFPLLLLPFPQELLLPGFETDRDGYHVPPKAYADTSSSIRPLDIDTIIKSVKKTGHLVTVEGGFPGQS
jgi:hypothetical protein